jgi:hypothetical protein
MKNRVRARLLRRLALVHGGELLLQLREEVLAGGHEVRHVACMALAVIHPRSWKRVYLACPKRRCFSLLPSRPGLCGIPPAGLGGVSACVRFAPNLDWTYRWCYQDTLPDG